MCVYTILLSSRGKKNVDISPMQNGTHCQVGMLTYFLRGKLKAREDI